ncbi:MAG: primase C-terminal domain-containing protein [Chloroflexi bacterium]|nr:primase C-terminal domain-containing protein [Chloroflexota bacterium]
MGITPMPFPETPLAPMPGWVLQAVQSPAPPLAATVPSGALNGHQAGTIPEGQRNATLTSLAGSVRRRGVSEAGILALLGAENTARCDPPLPAAEVQAIARSVARYAPGAGESAHRNRNDTESTAVPTWPDPEDRGSAVLSDLGTVEYVEDMVRPGRITVWAAEEGTGKSYATAGEMGVRIAVAGGDFAGTWPVLQQGPVLVLSEMHTDDDYLREDRILESLGHTRSELTGRYFRLSLMTGGKPLLMDPEWRTWITAWLQAHDALLCIVDTATAATNVDPWGPEIQGVYRGLRQMQEMYPALAILLCVHLKKPQGRGERRISDVLGEWGRWCDVLILQENDGNNLHRTKLTVRKRVRQERRIMVTKKDGLLADPQDLEGTGPKVPLEKVIAAITADPGLSLAQLAATLKVAKTTASGYVEKAAKDGLVETHPGPRGAVRVFPTVHRPVASNVAMTVQVDGPAVNANR